MSNVPTGARSAEDRMTAIEAKQDQIDALIDEVLDLVHQLLRRLRASGDLAADIVDGFYLKRARS